MIEVARWLLRGTFDPEHTLERAAPAIRSRQVLSGLQVAAATIAVWLSTAALLYWLAGKWLGWLDHICWPVCLCFQR